jgi:hypothetical protein
MGAPAQEGEVGGDGKLGIGGHELTSWAFLLIYIHTIEV